jgi:conjugative relaxase-like TrwC/TraI family protein
MLSITRIAPGAGMDYLMRQIAAGREDFRPAPRGSPMTYFADPDAHGEAPGWWAGQSHALFGVQGNVTDQQADRLIGRGQNPVTGQHLGRLWRAYVPMTDEYRKEAVERAWRALPADATYEQIAAVWLRIWTMPERRAVAGFDVTVSPVKSVSLLWAFGDDTVKAQVMAAQHAGVRAALAHLRQHGAFTRLGVNGIVQVDTDGLAAMVFDHRMSREKDPQLHSHIIVSSKVRTITAEGREQWLSLDSRAFYQASIGARVVYERAVEGELARRLGVRFAPRPGSQIREVVGIDPAAIRQYSKRRAAIEAEMAHRTAGGGVPERLTGRRWRRRAQDATLRTRRRKDEPESTRDAVRRWAAEDRQAGLDTVAQVRDIVAGRVHDEVDRLGRHVLRVAAHRAVGGRVDESDLYCAALALNITDDEMRTRVVDAAVRRDPRLAVQRAVRELAEQHSVWRLDHLELAIGRHLNVDPKDPVARDWRRVTQLAAGAFNARAAGLRPLTPPALMSWSPHLVRGSDRQPVYTRHRDLWMTTDRILAAEQEVIAYAARRGATTAPTTLLDRIGAQLDLSPEKRDALRFLLADDRRVTGIVGPAGTGKTYLQRAVGLAAQQAGVPVLGLTVGQNAAEVLAQATEQGDLTGVRTENVAKWLHAQHHPPEDSRPGQWEFQPGQWVIVDEASQASTLQLAELVRLLAPVGGKLLLVGDPAQVSAVGPGGVFRYLASLGHTTQLREVRRFTAAWEGPASLRLRNGDTTVVAEYDRRGRIHSGHRENLIERMLDGWASDMLAGRDALILVETEAEAADIAAHARLILRQAGIVPAGRTVTLANGTHAGAGDLIVTRRNDRRLIVDAGSKFVANRDRWKVLDVGPDGSLLVQHTRTDDLTTLPAAYVAQDVQLAYAATVDSAQGRTVYAARALVDENTNRSRLYVMMTRGSHLNQLYVVVDDEPPEGHQPAAPKAGISVVADILRRDDTDRSATETEQTLWADHDNLYYWGQVYDDLVGRTNAGRYAAVVRAVAGPVVARRLVDDPAMPALACRLAALAQAGYDPDEVLAAAAGQRELDSARDVAAVLAWRIDQLYDDVPPDPTVALNRTHTASYTARVPETAGQFTEDLRRVAQICDGRVRGLAEEAAVLRPAWSTALGVVPDDVAERGRWLAGARVVLTYRDRYQITGDDPIGPEPSTRDPARWAAWIRAQTVLSVATLAGQIRAASDPELRTMIDAQRAADAAAPPYVAGALRTAHVALIAAQQHHREVRLALAAAETTATRRAQLAASATPRWWHVGPLQTRAAAQHATAQTAANRAHHAMDGLRTQLADAATQIIQRRANVAGLETQHQHWTSWYQQALPTRYTGLAAAAENALRAQRAADNTRELVDAVRDTAARVRAVNATQPQPHVNPVPQQLAQAAEAGRDRATVLAVVEDDPLAPDPNTAPEIGL